MHWIVPLVASASLASAQLIAYESFSGMPTGGGVSGSGSDATGWTQSSWQASTSPYHSIGNQAPNMTYQITNGGLVSGGDRCVVLSTAPEPTAGTNAVTRNFPPLNSTFFVSFLVRPLTVGTGSDKLMLQLRGGTNLLGGVKIQPDSTQSYFQIAALDAGNSGSYSGGRSLQAGSTYLIVLRISRPFASWFSCEGWISPSQSPQEPNVFSGNSYSIPSSATNTDTLSLSTYSFDNGGPSSTIAMDEIRIGYTWNDVVPQSTTQTVVPTLSIAPAMAVNWLSKTNKTYQPQRSYDMTNWVDFGATISGNGQQRSFLDSADQVPKSFYRVIER